MRDEFILISGPCGLENEKVPMEVCEGVLRIIEKYKDIKFIFKSSFEKANRTKLDSFTGLEFDQAMKILQKVKETYGVKVITDVHECVEVAEISPFVDYLQIPAYLMRQTKLIQAAAKAKPLNIKKAQFASADDAGHALVKAKAVGQEEVFLCERGSTFGYDTLVVDFTNIMRMQKFGAPVILDATHCLQRKLSTGISGGQREYISHMCNAGVAVGVDGIFAEVHSDIENAKSDKDSQARLQDFAEIVDRFMSIREVLKGK